MKTLEAHYREQLETEIVTALCQRPDYIGSLLITENDFFSKANREIFQEIVALYGAGKDVSLIALTERFDVSGIKHLFDTQIFNLFDTPSFTEAVKKLHEDTTRHQLLRMADQCGDSVEYMNYIDTTRSTGQAISINTFEKELALYRAEYEERKTRMEKEGTIGIVTGWQNFDRKFSMTPQDFVVIGARTSIGKTAFSLELSVRAAAFHHKVLFLSMEMSRSNIFDRVFANLLQENSRDLQLAQVPFSRIAQEANAIAKRWRFVNAPDLTSDHVANLMSKSSFDLVVVDYLQLLKDPMRKGENENNRLGRISGKLKQLASRHNCVVIANAQLNRNSEKTEREPYLSDLRDSGCIEQDADKVLLLHREKRDSTEMKAIIAKNRVGELGSSDFAYLPHKNTFKEIDSIYVNVPAHA